MFFFRLSLINSILGVFNLGFGLIWHPNRWLLASISESSHDRSIRIYGLFYPRIISFHTGCVFLFPLGFEFDIHSILGVFSLGFKFDLASESVSSAVVLFLFFVHVPLWYDLSREVFTRSLILNLRFNLLARNHELCTPE